MQKLEIAQFGEYVFLRIVCNNRQFHLYELRPLTDFISDLASHQLSCRGLKELSWVLTMPDYDRAWKMTQFLLTVKDNDDVNATNPQLEGFERSFIDIPAGNKKTLVYCVPCPHQDLKLKLRKLPEVNHVQMKWPFVIVEFKDRPFQGKRLGPLCKKRVAAREVANVLGLPDTKKRLVLPF